MKTLLLAAVALATAAGPIAATAQPPGHERHDDHRDAGRHVGPGEARELNRDRAEIRHDQRELRYDRHRADTWRGRAEWNRYRGVRPGYWYAPGYGYYPCLL